MASDESWGIENKRVWSVGWVAIKVYVALLAFQVISVALAVEHAPEAPSAWTGQSIESAGLVMPSGRVPAAAGGGGAGAAEPGVKSGTFTTSDGVRMHYLEAGSGPAIVFVPGWTMPAWIWDAQIKHFARQYHVAALDPRSQGESEKVSQGNSPERRSQDVKELCEHLKLGPAVLVGWSLAVPELLTYAEQFGGASVRAYVLVDGFLWEK